MLVRFRSFVAKFLAGEGGPTAVEYAIMMSLIIVVCFAAVLTVGTKTNTTYQAVGSQLGNISGS
jgi:pilus assembly protein Flp/PilA